MLETEILSETGRMRKDLSLFLEGHLRDPAKNWPRSRRPGRNPAALRGSSHGLDVLVVGELALELTVCVETTCRHLRGAMKSRSAERLRWRMSRVRLGGFAVHAGRAAASLGHRVSICTTVPAPLPPCFEKLFTEDPFDTRYVTACPGSSPMTIRACCRDGELTARRPGAFSDHAPQLPKRAVAAFDVVLVDASSCAACTAVLNVIRQSLQAQGGPTRVGLRVGDQWCSHVLALARDPRVWTFVRVGDWQEFARERRNLQCGADRRLSGGCAGDHYGVRRLVLQQGARGAVLLNGRPDPCRAHTCPVRRDGRAGAGATLQAITTLSSALGSDDPTSLQRGVDAATAYLADLDLPVTLAELDAV